jgi:hypothetical protein
MQKGFAAVLGSLIERLVSRFGKEIPSIAGLDHLHASSVRNRLEEGEGRPDLRVPRRRERRGRAQLSAREGKGEGARLLPSWAAACWAAGRGNWAAPGQEREEKGQAGAWSSREFSIFFFSIPFSKEL